MACLVGIDSGMANVKAVVIDDERGLMAEASVACAAAQGPPPAAQGPPPAAQREGEGRFEIDMRRYWDAVVQCLRRFQDQGGFDLRDVRGIAVASQGVTFVPVDARGFELGNAIGYYDTRARDEARAISEAFPADAIHRATGQPAVDPALEAPKLLWLRRHEPERLRAADKILLVHDYLLLRLAGEPATVRSIQSSSLLLDIRARAWWPEMLEFVGLAERQLPRLVDHGEAVGTVSREAAEATGLPRHAVVVAGGIDQVCGMVGVGNTEPGILSESTGSVLAVHAVSPDPFPRRDAGVYTFRGADERTYALMPVSPSAGSVLAWFAETFCAEERRDDSGTGAGIYDRLAAEAAAVAPGSDGLLMLPHLAGRGTPRPNPDARGAFHGFTLAHGRGHFVRALLEGVACLLRSGIDVLRDAGFGAPEIRSFGGGSQSGLWNQIKADLCGMPVVTPSIGEAGCLGAAILGGVGCGVFSSIEEGCRRLVRLREPVLPDPSRRAAYERLYERHVRLCRALEPFEGG